jgi:hypothetical protein
MASNLAEWMVRTVMLVLAGLVTLSILGSIAAMSNDAAAPGAVQRGGAPAFEPAPASLEASPPPVSPAAPSAEPAAEPSAQAPVPGGENGMIAAAPEVPEAPEVERWLEAIAYALLAIAGLLALGLILLWRAVSALRRIADRAALVQHHHQQQQRN